LSLLSSAQRVQAIFQMREEFGNVQGIGMSQDGLQIVSGETVTGVSHSGHEVVNAFARATDKKCKARRQNQMPELGVTSGTMGFAVTGCRGG